MATLLIKYMDKYDVLRWLEAYCEANPKTGTIKKYRIQVTKLIKTFINDCALEGA